MAGRYVAFTRSQFEDLMTRMGFQEILLSGVGEHTYQRVVHNGPFPSSRFVVRIYSSVDALTGRSRDIGGDAIRVMLIDTKRDRPVVEWSIHRTQNAFDRVRDRAKEAWGYVMKPAHHCPNCSALMVERKGRRGIFLGCTAYPDCKTVRPIAEAA